MNLIAGLLFLLPIIFCIALVVDKITRDDLWWFVGWLFLGVAIFGLVFLSTVLGLYLLVHAHI